MTTATAVKSRPILFSDAMVRAIRDGRKTQTRRVVKPFKLDRKGAVGVVIRAWPMPNDPCGFACEYIAGKPPKSDARGWSPMKCPYGIVGERLWVKEVWHGGKGSSGQPAQGYVSYRADGEMLPHFVAKGCRWQSPRFMPRWASRLTLEITGLRVERLLQITDHDAAAEGVAVPWEGGAWPWLSRIEAPWRSAGQADNAPRLLYRHLWDTIHGAGSWQSDPWVWVIEFRRLVSGGAS